MLVDTAFESLTCAEAFLALLQLLQEPEITRNFGAHD